MARYALLLPVLAAFAVADGSGWETYSTPVADTSTTSTTSTNSWTGTSSSWTAGTTPVSADPWSGVSGWESWTDPAPTITTTTTWSNVVDPTTVPTWTAWGTTREYHKKKIVTVTLTEEYIYPCPTGWATETYTILTTWCGCKETPMPQHPEYQTVTTTCPESWGVGQTVTLTVPYVTWTPSQTANPGQWSNAAQWNNQYNGVLSSALYAYSSAVNAVTWASWNSASSTWVYVNAASTSTAATQCSYTTAAVTTVCDQWAAWDVSKTGTPSCTTSTTTSTVYPTTCTGTSASWTTATSTPVAATQCSYTTTTSVTSVCNQWASWDISKTGSPSCVTSTATSTVYPTSCSNGVLANSSTAWGPVATFTGAASAKGPNAVIAVVGAAAGFAYLL